MKGSYNIVVTSSSIEYNINIKHSISVIRGMSGIGKTYLYKLLVAMKRGSKTVRCNLADKIELLEYNTDWGSLIPNSHDKIFIADENTMYIFSSEFASVAQMSDNYFVFITRNSLKCFTYASDAVYTFEAIKGEHYINKTVNMYNDVILNAYKPDVVLCEDVGSGFSMFNEIFNIPVVSAGGKDNIVSFIKSNESYANIYIIADGAGFGSCVNGVLRIKDEGYANFKLFLPPSFEYMLLLYQRFKSLVEDKLVHTENYCDTKEFKSWERFYTFLMESVAKRYNFIYTKSYLSDKLKFSKMYDNIKSQIEDLDKGVFK